MFLYMCQLGKTSSIQNCNFCTQSAPHYASCSNFQVPPNFCTNSKSGWYCYSAFGTTVQTSVRCEAQKIYQQNVCPGICDDYSGECKTGTKSVSTDCPSICTYGCTFPGVCNYPPFCTKTKTFDSANASFCGSLVNGRSIENQLSVVAQDNDAHSWYNHLSVWAGTTYPTDCLSKISNLACEKKFLNCAEKNSNYNTCQNLCQATISCMQSQLTTAGISVAIPINCNVECSSAYRLGVSTVYLVVLMVAMSFLY